jgi:hypothetical protein
VHVSVTEPRGEVWEESIAVPRGLRMTLELEARYDHRGYEGTVRNATTRCRGPGVRARLRFDIFADREVVASAIELNPGASAPGIRLRPGSYEVLVSAMTGRDWEERARRELVVSGANWRFDEGCEP